jgi:hypothetical protein
VVTFDDDVDWRHDRCPIALERRHDDIALSN